MKHFIEWLLDLANCPKWLTILHNYKLIVTSFLDNSRNSMNLLMESNEMVALSCEQSHE